ncbi:MAG: DUF2007 domain-containing protein [Planctomycetaceae bacterium]|nr:DUF2007 domain-containing protein [Planctomycetaceae bacterium]
MNDNERLVSVYRSSDVGRAEVIRAALIGEGIECAIENEHQAGLTGVTEVRLHVSEGDAERAREFIRSHEHSHDHEIE